MTVATCQPIHAADLLLCEHALAGEAEALADVVAKIDVACQRVMTTGDAARVDEVAQRIRVALLSPLKGGTPRLKQYEGRASLRSWLRVVAAREALQISKRPEVTRWRDWEIEEFCDGSLAAGVAMDRTHFALRFKEAFAAGFESLSIHERTVLRQHYRDGIAISALAKVRRVHRGTLARELAHIRQRLECVVSGELSRLLGISISEQKELRYEMASQLDASLSRLFREIPES